MAQFAIRLRFADGDHILETLDFRLARRLFVFDLANALHQIGCLGAKLDDLIDLDITLFGQVFFLLERMH